MGAAGASSRGERYKLPRKPQVDVITPLLYPLVAFGQIQLRKVDGHAHVSERLSTAAAMAA